MVGCETLVVNVNCSKYTHKGLIFFLLLFYMQLLKLLRDGCFVVLSPLVYKKTRPSFINLLNLVLYISPWQVFFPSILKVFSVNHGIELYGSSYHPFNIPFFSLQISLSLSKISSMNSFVPFLPNSEIDFSIIPSEFW